MQDFFVYILLCSDNSYYIGHTDCIERRLAEALIDKNWDELQKLSKKLFTSLESFEARSNPSIHFGVPKHSGRAVAYPEWTMKSDVSTEQGE